MQSSPRSRTAAAKISTEIILEQLYPRSCRLEAAIELLLPSCDLYNDTDPPTYIKLCSGALVATESDNLLSPDNSPSQALSAINALPSSCRLGWNDQAPLETVLSVVPDEKFTVDLRYPRKRIPFYAFLTDIGFETLNNRIGSGLLLRLLIYCSFFIPLENNCYLQITGTPIYNHFNMNTIPIRRQARLISQRLLHCQRMRRRERRRRRKMSKRKRRIRKRKRHHECPGRPPSKRIRLEVTPTAASSATSLQAIPVSSKQDIAALKAGGQSLTAFQEDMDTTVASTGTKQICVDDQAGEAPNKSNGVSKCNKDGQKGSYSNSDVEVTTSVHSNSKSCLVSGHQRTRKRSAAYPLMTSETKRAKRKKEKCQRKEAKKKLRQRLERGSDDIRKLQRSRLKNYLQHLRKRAKASKTKKRKAIAASTAEGKSKSTSSFTQKKVQVINRKFMFYSSTKQSFTNLYALQWLQPTVNDTKKLVAYIFNGRPIQDGAKRNTLGSVPTSARLSNQVENSTTRRKTLLLSKRLQQALPHFQQLLYNHKSRMHYAGLLDYYCPVSTDLLLLAAGATTKQLPEELVVAQHHPPASHNTVGSATLATTTAEQSGAEEGCIDIKQKRETDDDFVSPELFEDPLPSDGAASGTSTRSSGAAGHGGRHHHQGRPALMRTAPPLKETIAKLILEGRLYYNQVCGFLKAVLTHLVPMALWGSVQNRQLFFKHVEKFVRLRRFETLNVQDLMHRYKLSCCQWLKLPSPSGRGRPHPPSFPLCKKFLYWLMNEVVIRTIKAHFYVTEHSAYRNQVFYYRKELWACVEKLAVREKTESFLAPTTRREVQWMRSMGKILGVSKLRFLPKLTGVRPIINLRSKVKSSNEPTTSINYQLQSAFLVLNLEMKRRPHLVGSSCFGKNDVHQKLKDFAVQQKKVDPQKEGPLFFVHMDIATCYDSILPTKLYDILVKDVLSRESYLLRRYTKVHLSPHGIKRRFIKTAITRDNKEPFYDFAFNCTVHDGNCILTDQIAYPVVKREALVDVLKKHLFGNLVKLGYSYFRQAEGISQGSKLSTMLCGFYYADMEKKCLPRVNPRKGLLLRYVDDFLLITREPEVAKEFLTTLQRGLPEYNCRINVDKTATNFDILPDGSLKRHKREWMEWCGFLVSTSSLEVKINSSKYASTDIGNRITMRLNSNPVLCLHRFIKRCVQLTCLPLFLDGQMQAPKTVACNVYESFVIVAMKFIVFVRSVPEWYPSCGIQKNVKRKHSAIFFRLVMDSVYSFVKQAQDSCTKVSAIFNLPRVVCWWLCCSAYRKVVEKHEPTRLKLLSKFLTYRMVSFSNAMSVQWIKLCHRTVVKSSIADKIPP